MDLLSVNIGKRRTHTKGAALETTGIYKLPVDGPVRLDVEGIEEDSICDTKDHGGPDQAVYVYGQADYEWWERELGRPLAPGTFGENLTISDLESADVRIGDRLHVGGAVLEVTAARIPCSTLAARMRDGGFVKRFRSAERPGFYCRVLEAGIVRAGDQVERIPAVGTTVSILEMFRNHYERPKNEADLRRILRAPISVRARAKIEEDLQEAMAAKMETGRDG